MKQSAKIRTTNYKGEEYTNIENVQSQMETVANELKANFEKNKILSVIDFIGKKAKLRELFNETFNNLDENGEYTGIYLFAEKKGKGYKYLYTGITRKAIMRLNDHVSSNNKSSATWAYLKVKESEEFYMRIKEFHHRSKLTDDEKNKKNKLQDDIKNEIERIQKECFSKLYVTFLPIKNDNFFLHMIEPYIACEFKCKWNSFETH